MIQLNFTIVQRLAVKYLAIRVKTKRVIPKSVRFSSVYRMPNEKVSNSFNFWNRYFELRIKTNIGNVTHEARFVYRNRMKGGLSAVTRRSTHLDNIRTVKSVHNLSWPPN